MKHDPTAELWECQCANCVKKSMEKCDLGARECPGGPQTHEAHMRMNGDCPWCGSYDKAKWV